MTTAAQQLDREARYDVRVAVIGIAIFFGCMILLPRSWFWFYALPMIAFWIRYIVVRDRRDAVLERAVASTESSAGAFVVPGGGICIDDGTTQLVIGRPRTGSAPSPKLISSNSSKLLRLQRP